MQQQMLLLRQRQHMLQQQLQQRHQIRWRLGRLLDFVVYIYSYIYMCVIICDMMIYVDIVCGFCFGEGNYCEASGARTEAWAYTVRSTVCEKHMDFTWLCPEMRYTMVYKKKNTNNGKPETNKPLDLRVPHVWMKMSCLDETWWNIYRLTKIKLTKNRWVLLKTFVDIVWSMVSTRFIVRVVIFHSYWDLLGMMISNDLKIFRGECEHHWSHFASGKWLCPKILYHIVPIHTSRIPMVFWWFVIFPLAFVHWTSLNYVSFLAVDFT